MGKLFALGMRRDVLPALPSRQFDSDPKNANQYSGRSARQIITSLSLLDRQVRMKHLTIISAFIAALNAAPSMAVQRSGNDLLVDCTNLIKTESIESVSTDQALGVGYCIGLIDGMVTFNYIYESVFQAEGNSDPLQMCLPQRISTRMLAAVIVKHLEAHPGQLHQSGQALAAQALVTAYPCDKETPP